MEFLSELQYYIFESSAHSLILTWAFLYIIYYNLKVKHIPKLIAKQGKFKAFLQEKCPILKEVFAPTIWCFDARLQTIIQTFIRPISCLNAQRELIQTWDGGQVILDWMDDETDAKYPPDERPIVLFLPGLVGSTSANYIQYMIRQVYPSGYRCVVFNYRGVMGDKLKTPRTYCASCTRDLASVVDHVTSKYPQAPVVAVGFSLGGIILFNYAASSGANCPLKAIMTIASPWDPHKSANNLERPLNMILFNRTLLSYLLECISNHKEIFSAKINLDSVFKSRTIREFDDKFTSQVFGYKNVDAYYQDSKLTPEKVKKIDIPAFCMAAKDDPFIPEGSFPLDAVEESDNVALFLTDYGGHGGFLEGFWPWRRANYMDRVFKQYVEAVMENSEMLGY